MQYMQCYKESIQLTHDLNASEHNLAAAPRESVATATSVQLRNGKRLITDGPFAETREKLGGYFLVGAANPDEAINRAARIPGARNRTIEVRPVVQLDGMPEYDNISSVERTN